MKKETLYTHKEVDQLLHYLSQHFHPQSDQFFHVVNIQHYSNSTCNWWYKLDLSLRVSLLKRLEQEGYVQHYFIKVRNVGYQVTTKGMAFVKSGGYNTHRKERKKKKRKKLLHKLSILLLAVLTGVVLTVLLLKLLTK